MHTKQIPTTDLTHKAKEIYHTLKKYYPNAHCTLNYKSPFQLLIMTILASQCTDERVNQVCEPLFQHLKTPLDFIQIGQRKLEKLIHPVGFYRNKAKNIINTCKILIEKYAGQVPNTMEELLTLPGVGRKTANVILGECFNTPAIIVDTHFQRLTQRLGLTQNSAPDKIESDTKRLLPPQMWTLFSHLLVFHGRNICLARKPKCHMCPINHLCDFYQNTQNEQKS